MPRVHFGTYSLEAPDTWTLHSVILAGPIDEAPAKGMPSTKAVRPFQRNMITTMERVDSDETLESYLKRQADGLREAGVQPMEARPTEKVTLGGGVQGILVEQIIPGPGGERVRQMQLIAIKDGIAHTVIASHLDGPFEGARGEFKKMLLSFQ